MIEIKLLDAPHMKKTVKFAVKVFPYRALSVCLSFLAHRHKNNRLVKALMGLAGFSSLPEYWIAVNEDGGLCGVIGIYGYKKDSDAVWMAWFCVDPGKRGQGVGKRLIEHCVEQARGYGKRYFRLYTSTLRSEAAAQGLYEKYGFRLTKEKNRLFYKLLYRELALT